MSFKKSLRWRENLRSTKQNNYKMEVLWKNQDAGDTSEPPSPVPDSILSPEQNCKIGRSTNFIKNEILQSKVPVGWKEEIAKKPRKEMKQLQSIWESLGDNSIQIRWWVVGPSSFPSVSSEK